jgi:hypothetical protein
MSTEVVHTRPTRSVLDGIGNTPLIQVDGIWFKLAWGRAVPAGWSSGDSNAKIMKNS